MAKSGTTPMKNFLNTLSVLKVAGGLIVAVATVVTIVYTSQAAQDEKASVLQQRVAVCEANSETLQNACKNTAQGVTLTTSELAKTRVELAKLAVHQETISIEQRHLRKELEKFNEKLDGLKTMLIELAQRDSIQVALDYKSH